MYASCMHTRAVMLVFPSLASITEPFIGGCLEFGGKLTVCTFDPAVRLPDYKLSTGTRRTEVFKNGLSLSQHAEERRRIDLARPT